MWKVATWNVNSVNVRLERLLAFLKREAPDVLALQEIKCTEDKYPLQAITDAGYHSLIWGQKTYNGVALLSKEPLTNVERGFSDFQQEARYLCAEIRGVRVASVYVPNGQEVGAPKYAFKLQWLAALQKQLQKELKKGDCLLMGDFNVAPEDRDCYDPSAWKGKILCSEQERKAIQSLCEHGLADTFRKHEPSEGKYSWWDYRQLAFPKGRGLRIDFVLASKNLYQQCTGARIDRDERKGKQPSDHAPVIAEFE